MLEAEFHRIMVRSGSLESTQEARVALGYRLEQLFRFFNFVLYKLPKCTIIRWSALKHELIVKTKARCDWLYRRGKLKLPINLKF